MMRRSVMNDRQNSGKASSDSTMNCGRHPTTSAMHSDPTKYQAHAWRDSRARIQQYSPHTLNASAHMMGSE